jgi:hypothetical protein
MAAAAASILSLLSFTFCVYSSTYNKKGILLLLLLLLLLLSLILRKKKEKKVNQKKGIYLFTFLLISSFLLYLLIQIFLTILLT